MSRADSASALAYCSVDHASNGMVNNVVLVSYACMG